MASDIYEMKQENKGKALSVIPEPTMLEQLRARKAEYENKLYALKNQIKVLEQNPLIETFIQNLKNI